MSALERHVEELARSLASSIIATFISTPIAELDLEPARSCRLCGCTDDAACPGGCAWAESDLCSACVTKPAKKKRTHARTHARASGVPSPGPLPRESSPDAGVDRDPFQASSPAARFVSERRSSVRRISSEAFAARARKIRLASRARAGEARCEGTTVFGQGDPRCVRAARWLVVGKKFCTIHAKRARRDARVGGVLPMMLSLAPSGPPCCLCNGRGVLRVGKASIVPAWCPCTPLGRELANGRPDDEVLRELAGDEDLEEEHTHAA